MSHIPGYLEEVKHLYRGNKMSNCPMPCTTYRTTTRMISKRATNVLGRVILSFSEKVTMRIIKNIYVLILKVSLSSSLSGDHDDHRA